MGKTMQMPTEFVTGVYALLGALEAVELDDSTRALCRRLESQLQAKLAAMERREVFSAYKGKPDGSIEREALRREYLDMAGIHPDWQSRNEVHP